MKRGDKLVKKKNQKKSIELVVLKRKDLISMKVKKKSEKRKEGRRRRRERQACEWKVKKKSV